MRAYRVRIALLGALVLFVGACTATALAASTPNLGASPAVVATATSTGAPTLGIKTSQAESGFGTVRPKTVDFGGDGTSLVTKVKWSSWGGKQAVGHGRAEWVWPGWCVACGSVSLKATVVAYDLGGCHGHQAYRYVEWFFPSRGQTFSKQIGEGNLCAKRLTSTRNVKQRECGTGELVGSGGKVVGRAKEIDADATKCAPARAFVKISGAMTHYRHNARFHKDGWWCGAELSMEFDSKPWQDYTCAKGDVQQVSFAVKPAN